MKKIVSIALLAIVFSSAKAQISTLGNNKPLAYLNPALQNYETNTGVISLSGLASPLAKEDVPLAYLAIGEYKVNEDFRVGIHTSSVENRLSAITSSMAYASYRLALEKGNYLVIGLDIGTYTHTLKNNEFNKVLAPNKFTFGSDSSSIGKSTGIDFGLGFTYAYNGFIGGIDFSKMNTPETYLFPGSFVDASGHFKDTLVNYREANNFTIEVGLNLIYNWNFSKKVSVTHSAHVSNVGRSGAGYIALQNFVEFSKKHSLGLGIFRRETTGFIASAGVGLSEKIKFEVTTFVEQDLIFDPKISAYKNVGYTPSFEANLRVQF